MFETITTVKGYESFRLLKLEDFVNTLMHFIRLYTSYKNEQQSHNDIMKRVIHK